MYSGKTVGVIIAAAGSGTRMEQAAGLPKQFMLIDGVPMVRKTAEVFARNAYVDDICIAVNGAYAKEYEEALSGLPKIRCTAVGGKERQNSVGEALRRLAEVSKFDYVMIHDAARPYVTNAVIEESLAAALRHGAAVAAVPVKDTIRQGGITLERDNLFCIQTPQTFERRIIIEAYERACSDGYIGTDDGSLVERLGRPVAISQGDYANIKITTKEDLPMKCRVGTGYDVHRLEAGRPLILGGVRVPHDKGLLGHSDADVLVHAVMDALLGAIAAGDIGKHFSDTDPRYKGISSIKLLVYVGNLIRESGYAVTNVDATVIAEKPKISAYTDEMRANIAEALRIDIQSVSVKATTTEKLGFTGREEGISAYATVLIVKE